jgi:outer membrane protein, heavy metal efflux system
MRPLLRIARIALTALVLTEVGTAQAKDRRPSGTTSRLTVGDGPPLALGTVLGSVRRHHPLIETARQDVLAARGEQREARGAFDPVLSADLFAAPVGPYAWRRADVVLEQPTPLWGSRFYAGWRHGSGAVPPYLGGYATSGPGEVRAGVTVPLWLDGPIDPARARIWAAEHAIEAEQNGLRAQELHLARDAAGAYWQWVAAGLRYTIVSDLLALAEARDVQIRKQVAAGSLAEIEVLENQRSILLRQRAVVAAERGIEQTAIMLSLYLRQHDGSPRVPSPSELPAGIAVQLEHDVDEAEAVRRAIAARPELERYAALLRRSQVNVDFAKSRLAPRVDVGVGGAVDIGDNADPRLLGRGPARVETGVSVAIPLPFRQARGGVGGRPRRRRGARRPQRTPRSGRDGRHRARGRRGGRSGGGGRAASLRARRDGPLRGQPA